MDRIDLWNNALLIQQRRDVGLISDEGCKPAYL